MRSLLVIGMLCWGWIAYAQDGRLPLEHFVTQKAEILLKEHVQEVHPEIKPYSYWTLQKYAPAPDSAVDFERLAFRTEERSIYVRATPRLALNGFNQGGSNYKRGMTGLGGVALGLGIKNRFYVNVEGLIGYTNPASYYHKMVDSLGVMPGFGYVRKSGDENRGFDYNQLTLCAAFKASKHFEFFMGRGNHFIGEGYRSVFLSDFASNYNYLRTDMSVWRIKYMMMYTQMRQSADYPLRMHPLTNKYAVMHYLSLNLTKWWSVGAFESVVWESEDSVMKRGFDFNYLNPAIFFRPVEYGMGSSDNSLLGFSSSLRPTKDITLYGQFLLDEFLFGEWSSSMRKAISGDSTILTGYWANKQSYQLGVKYLEPLGWKSASVLAEVNIVRPFTYGHSNPRQSYTHLNQSLAHPLGSNFIEWVQVTTWQPGPWKFALFATYSRKGYSNQIAFMGEDPLISNREHDEINREHGNFLTQGRRVDVGNLRMVAGYTLIESWNLRAEAVAHYRGERSAGEKRDMIYFGLGVRTALWNNYQNL